MDQAQFLQGLTARLQNLTNDSRLPSTMGGGQVFPAHPLAMSYLLGLRFAEGTKAPSAPLLGARGAALGGSFGADETDGDAAWKAGASAADAYGQYFEDGAARLADFTAYGVASLESTGGLPGWAKMLAALPDIGRPRQEHGEPWGTEETKRRIARLLLGAGDPTKKATVPKPAPLRTMRQLPLRARTRAPGETRSSPIVRVAVPAAAGAALGWYLWIR